MNPASIALDPQTDGLTYGRTDGRTYGRTTFVGVAPAVVFVRTPSRMDVVRFNAGDLCVVRVAHLLRRRLQSVRSTTHFSG